MVTEDAKLATFGERIRTLRIYRGLNQKELAAYVGIGESTLSRYENDKRAYRWDGLIKLADALDTSVDFLLGRTGVTASVNRIVSDEKPAGGDISFLDAYCDLNLDDRNLLMERAITLYDVRSKDKEKDT
jgi:transcriptional regulator with XRE-family HTH domain